MGEPPSITTFFAPFASFVIRFLSFFNAIQFQVQGCF